MTLEEDIVSAISALVEGRVFYMTAPFNTPRPFILYSHVGGRPTYTFCGDTTKQNARIQFNVWDKIEASSAAESVTIMRQLAAIDDAFSVVYPRPATIAPTGADPVAGAPTPPAGDTSVKVIRISVQAVGQPAALGQQFAQPGVQPVQEGHAVWFGVGHSDATKNAGPTPKSETGVIRSTA